MCVCLCDWNGKRVKKNNRKEEEPRGLQVAGTCGCFNVQGFKEGALIHPKQANHVAGVGVQAGDAQAEGVSRQSEVLALGIILQVCYLNDKAVKVPTQGRPGRSEAIPCNVRDGEVHHHGLLLLW